MNRAEIESALEGILETLAYIEHQRWAHWQQIVHGNGERLADGRLVLPAELVKRWDKQIETNYEDLSEAKKQSDREQVRRYLPLIVETLARTDSDVRLETATTKQVLQILQQLRTVLERTCDHPLDQPVLCDDCIAIGETVIATPGDCLCEEHRRQGRGLDERRAHALGRREGHVRREMRYLTKVEAGDTICVFDKSGSVVLHYKEGNWYTRAGEKVGNSAHIRRWYHSWIPY